MLTAVVAGPATKESSLRAASSAEKTPMSTTERSHQSCMRKTPYVGVSSCSIVSWSWRAAREGENAQVGLVGEAENEFWKKVSLSGVWGSSIWSRRRRIWCTMASGLLVADAPP